MPVENGGPPGGETGAESGSNNAPGAQISPHDDVTRKSELILTYMVPKDDADESGIRGTIEVCCEAELIVPFVFIERVGKEPTGKVKIHFLDQNAMNLWRALGSAFAPDHWEEIVPDENAESRGPCHMVVYGVPAGVSPANFHTDQNMVRPDTFEHIETYEKVVDGETSITVFCWFIGGITAVNARKCFAKGVFYKNIKYKHRRRDISRKEKECKHSLIITNTPAQADGRRVELAILNACMKFDSSINSRETILRTEPREKEMGTGCIILKTNNLKFVAAARAVITSEIGLKLNGQKLKFFADAGEYWAARSKDQQTATQPPPPPPPGQPGLHTGWGNNQLNT